MAHKVHPKIYRIKEMADWHSRGFYGKSFPEFLEEDFKIREFLKYKLKDAGIAEIIIERSSGKTTVSIEALRPGIIIGRGGGGVEILKHRLEKIIYGLRRGKSVKKIDIKIEVKELRNPWIRAALVGQWAADQIEKRVRFRRCLKQALDKVMANKEIKGARIEISGRLDGSEIARREWLQKGQLPRQTIRADIEYAHVNAYCSYGVIGIKVWLYKGEKT